MVCLYKIFTAYYFIEYYSNFIFLTLLFMHMGVLLACMSMYHFLAWCPLRREKGIESPRTGVLDGCEPPCMWVLGIETRFSGRTVCVLNCYAISSASDNF